MTWMIYLIIGIESNYLTSLLFYSTFIKYNKTFPEYDWKCSFFALDMYVEKFVLQ